MCAAGWVYVMQQTDGLLTSLLRINLLMTYSMEETRPSLGDMHLKCLDCCG